MSSVPASQGQALVFVDKVLQSQTAFSINTTSLVLSSAPSNGSNVEVYVFGSAGSGVLVDDLYVSNGSNTTYTLSQSSTTQKTFVYFNGVSQRPQADYQVTGNQLTLNTAAPNGVNVAIRTVGVLDVQEINVAPVSFATDVFTGTGACTVFTLSQGSTTSGTFVFLNGVAQKPGTDYSVGGAGNTVLTLTSAPANGSKVEVRTLGNFKTIENKTRISSQRFTANGVQTVFTLNEPSTSERTIVHIDGVAQVPDVDYVVAGNSLTITPAPLNGSVIEVRNFAVMVLTVSTSDLAYAQANNASNTANLAYTQANNARDTANSAYTQANSSYAQSNTAYALASNSILRTGDTISGVLTINAAGTGLNVTSNIAVGNITLTGNIVSLNVTNNVTANVVNDLYGNLRKVPQSGTDKATNYTLAATDIGRLIVIATAGSVTVPNNVFSTGDVVSIFNNSSSNIVMTLNPVNSFVSGNNTSKTTLNLATRGVATVLYISSNTCVITGSAS
ncbi:MAG: hypothetical protein EBU90_19810 [Proteobacteria bacterium]|nr:hypothetical protein [Pseudomonadota bacterium]